MSPHLTTVVFAPVRPLVGRVFSKPLADLSRLNAGDPIAPLKQIKAGNIDLNAVLDTSTNGAAA